MLAHPSWCAVDITRKKINGCTRTNGYNWQTTGKRVKVKDPIYHQDHTFEVWQVEINGQIHRFAAGEFSNCVWGFYLEKN